MESIQQDQKTLIVNNEIRGYLLETVKWGKFLAIIGYVGLGLMGLASLFMIAGASMMSEFDQPGMPLWAMAVMYLIMAVLYYFPVTYLYNFSVKTRRSLEATDNSGLTEGFMNLKSLFKFMGIMMIVVLSIYALVIVIGIFAFIFQAL